MSGDAHMDAAADAHEAPHGQHAGDADSGHGHKHGRHAAHAPPGHGPGAPLWMLSFADMMTNLLCFFILMSAFAPTQEGVLLEDGLGSIRHALNSIGLPGTMDGRTNPIQFHAGRVIYRPASSVNPQALVEPDGRILDANRDTLRDVIVQTLAQRGTATLPVPLLFEADMTALTPEHRAFLDEVARYLTGGRFRVRVDGYAFEEGGGRDQQGWLIAEKRARAVRDHLLRAGLKADRVACVGHGLLRFGPATQAGAPPSVQNRFGRRAVLITFLE